jgi:rhamnosyltransferase
MYISVIIPTISKRQSLLKTLIKSLCKQSIKKRYYEIIIIGDGYEINDEIRKYSNNVYSYSIKKIGVCGARNFGANKSRYNIIVFLDDDTIVKYDYLEQILKYFNNNLSVSAIGGTIIGYSSNSIIANYFSYRKYLYKPITIYGNIVSIITANCAFRKFNFRNVHGFSKIFDDYKAGAEDLDISEKMLLAGYKLGYCAEAIVWHKNREKISEFIKQHFRNGFGLYICSIKFNISNSDLGIPDNMNLFGFVKGIIKFIFITNNKLESKSLLSRFFQYVFDKNVKKKYILIYTLLDLIRKITIFWGFYRAFKIFKEEKKSVSSDS